MKKLKILINNFMIFLFLLFLFGISSCNLNSSNDNNNPQFSNSVNDNTTWAVSVYVAQYMNCNYPQANARVTIYWVQNGEIQREVGYTNENGWYNNYNVRADYNTDMDVQVLYETHFHDFCATSPPTYSNRVLQCCLDDTACD